jgi:hypothetical protein
MVCARVVCATALLGCLAWLATSPAALAQAEPERVPLIMEKLPPPDSATYKAIKKRAGKATGQVLTLTKTEMWSVPKENVEDVKKAAAQHGVGVSQLGADWNHVLHSAPADMAMTDKQKSIIEQAKASKATVGVGMMAAPGAPMVEYALTKNAGKSTAPKGLPKITVALSEKTVLTITRTTVEVKADMCVWRGTVDGTGAPATLMWWPGGKLAGNVQHEGHLYSIRHMGGDMHVVVEMSEGHMPQEHAPMPQRLRTNELDSRDDPLVNQGDASILRSKGGPKR